MREQVEASAPGRICLGGESLDWMVNGPSVVGAIPLLTKAKIREIPTNGRPFIRLRSGVPVIREKIRPLSESSLYNDSNHKYVEAAMDRVLSRVTDPCSFSLEIESKIPVKAGVGSSAAVSLATVAAAERFFGLNYSLIDICEEAYSAEVEIVRSGAGRMDFYACGFGGLLYLNCGQTPPVVEPHALPSNLKVVLVDTLTPHSTKSFISSKRQRFKEGDPSIFHYADTAQGMVENLRKLLSNLSGNQEEVGSMITAFHYLLRDFVSCSTQLLDECVATANKNGALGAKLTGTGNGGCMFALVDEDHREQVAAALAKLPVGVYDISIVKLGLSVQPSSI